MDENVHAFDGNVMVCVGCMGGTDELPDRLHLLLPARVQSNKRQAKTGKDEMLTVTALIALLILIAAMETVFRKTRHRSSGDGDRALYDSGNSVPGDGSTASPADGHHHWHHPASDAGNHHGGHSDTGGFSGHGGFDGGSFGGHGH